MSRFIAFLRAINVGGHTVKMDHLRLIFADLGFAAVETFIASGNVIFEAPAQSVEALEATAATGLRNALGYEVATFIRTDLELAQIAVREPFSRPALEAATALNVAFLAHSLGQESTRKLLALQTEIDDFAVFGREIYWLCRKKQSESTFSNAVLEKTLGVRSTLRGMATVVKLADRYAPHAGAAR